MSYMTSPWEDGAKVIFTDEAKRHMTAPDFGTRALGHDKTSTPYGVYTVRNTNDTLHDVYFAENGERWGVNWLTTIDQGVRNARALHSRAEKILAALEQAERCRVEMTDTLLVADAMRASDGHDPHPLSAQDVAATLRLIFAPLQADIVHWTNEVAARGHDITMAQKAFAQQYPEFASQEVEA